MAGAEDTTREVYNFETFFDRLENEGAIDVRDLTTSETEVDGLIFHHRGVQVPSHQVLFTWNENGDKPPTFTVDTSPLGPRTAWTTFDATKNWDLFLVLFDGGAVVAWMSDEEFTAEEASRFQSKSSAIGQGQFSFGVFFRFGPDWVEREEWAEQYDGPAMIQAGNGELIMDTEYLFSAQTEAIPPELRTDSPETPPEYLGIEDVEVSIDS